MMRVLLHCCCGPCAVYPSSALKREGHELRLYFYNPNIQPFREFEKRLEAFKQFAEQSGLPVILDESYEPEEFFRLVAFREELRCRFCYEKRLSAAARVARRGKFDAFTTTLLYSKTQNHGWVRELGEAAGAAQGVPFLYRDFREGWKEGIEKSKAMGLYRQEYCGCVFSERDRFLGSRRRGGLRKGERG